METGKSTKKLSLDVVQELLKVQENSFRCLVSSLLSNFNDRFDKLTKEVHDLQHRDETSQARCTRMRHRKHGVLG